MTGRSLAYLAFTVLFGLFAALFTQAPSPLAEVLTYRALALAIIALAGTLVSVYADHQAPRDEYVSPERRRRL